jgi:hypothetical protein
MAKESAAADGSPHKLHVGGYSSSTPDRAQRAPLPNTRRIAEMATECARRNDIPEPERLIFENPHRPHCVTKGRLYLQFGGKRPILTYFIEFPYSPGLAADARAGKPPVAPDVLMALNVPVAPDAGNLVFSSRVSRKHP